MDANHFDALARSLDALGTRRGALSVLLGGAVGLLGMAEAAGRKRKKRKKRKKAECSDPEANPISCPPGSTEPCCPEGTTCCSSGCCSG